MNKAQRKADGQFLHGSQLLDIFTHAPANENDFRGNAGYHLAKKLHHMESLEHTRAERICNGDIDPSEFEDAAHDDRLLDRLDKLLAWRKSKVPIFINGDPHGYALKIKSEWMHAHPKLALQRDMGGYGILAPDFN